MNDDETAWPKIQQADTPFVCAASSCDIAKKGVGGPGP
jgi:hypothetical protein